MRHSSCDIGQLMQLLTFWTTTGTNFDPTFLFPVFGVDILMCGKQDGAVFSPPHRYLHFLGREILFSFFILSSAIIY